MTGIRVRWLLLSCLFALAVGGCGVADRMGNQVDGSWAGDMLFSQNPQARVTVSAAETLNPDATGRALSVVVRTYQLGELDPFMQASMAQLWGDDAGALGTALLSKREMTILPGQARRDAAALSPRAQYLGVAVFFRNPEGGEWRVAFDAEALRDDGVLWSSDGVMLRLDGEHIVVERGSDLLVRQ